MLIDGRTIPDGEALESEVCIIGAGAAGITIARELAGSPFRVILLEGGGFGLDRDTQSLYQGEIGARPYFPLEDCRLRFFGGSTNHWGGWCRPLDPMDFEARPWIPFSGWPFGREVLDPYYERAQPICQIGPFQYAARQWSDAATSGLLPLDEARVETRMFQFSPRTNFGEAYRADVLDADNITTLLHSSALDLETTEEARRVRSVRVGTLEGNEFRVTARTFVLAAGGIANAQVLLASRGTMPRGLGNGDDFVGRFFMEHPHHNRAALFLPSRRSTDLGFYEPWSHGGTSVAGTLFLPDEVREREQILSVNASFHRTNPQVPDGYSSFRHLAREFRGGQWPEDFRSHLGKVIRGLDDVAGGLVDRFRGGPEPAYVLSWRSEQAPNPISRVRLTDETDALGMPRVRLEWRLTDLDLNTLRTAELLMAQEIGRAGVGRLRLPEDDGTRPWADDLVGGSHHMGTTRMTRDPRLGVVDENCRLHGTPNLFVAGSSVFPTGGSANPTLTIVALALRIADHLREELG